MHFHGLLHEKKNSLHPARFKPTLKDVSPSIKFKASKSYTGKLLRSIVKQTTKNKKNIFVIQNKQIISDKPFISETSPVL